MGKYETIDEVRENCDKYIAEALGVSEWDIVRSLSSECLQTKESRRIKELVTVATIKATAFRDMLLEQMAKWDKENPNEPMQFRFEICGSVYPKNHS